MVARRVDEGLRINFFPIARALECITVPASRCQVRQLEPKLGVSAAALDVVERQRVQVQFRATIGTFPMSAVRQVLGYPLVTGGLPLSADLTNLSKVFLAADGFLLFAETGKRRVAGLAAFTAVFQCPLHTVFTLTLVCLMGLWQTRQMRSIVIVLYRLW